MMILSYSFIRSLSIGIYVEIMKTCVKIVIIDQIRLYSLSLISAGFRFCKLVKSSLLGDF